MNPGLLYAFSAYLIWGLLPLYLHAMGSFSSLEILLHRMVWALAFLALVLGWRRQWAWLKQVGQFKVLAGFTLSALLLAANWFIYIWAVQQQRVVDASLGYFINPLVSVLLGVLVLKERLRQLQWLCLGLAFAGVVWLTVHAGQLPWIALTLALTFGSYGLLRKTATLGSLEGLTLETALLFPVAGSVLLWLIASDASHFVAASATERWMALLAGPITAIPLLLFAAGARRISMLQLGMLQYVGPTVQLLLGVWLWNEPFPAGKAAGYALIWLALIVFSLEALWQQRHNRSAQAQVR